MENRMVEDLQNLHMLATFDFQKMEELVQDLTNALDESTQKSSTNSSLTCLKRHSKRRRGRLRRYGTFNICGYFNGCRFLALEPSLG